MMGANGQVTGYDRGINHKMGLSDLEKRERKKMLRKQLKDRIEVLSMDYCRTADEIIFRKLISRKEYQDADCVFCYVGTEKEINTIPILEHTLKSGKRLAVPKCISYGKMEAVEIRSIKELRPGAYGILEADEKCSVISPKEITFACIPCLSCSSDGKRLGYGGGFYDRYIPKLSCAKAVLCRKKLLDEDIPVEEHDILIDLVVTD